LDGERYACARIGVGQRHCFLHAEPGPVNCGYPAEIVDGVEIAESTGEIAIEQDCGGRGGEHGDAVGNWVFAGVA
jgi:hypothetical protein